MRMAAIRYRGREWVQTEIEDNHALSFITLTF